MTMHLNAAKKKTKTWCLIVGVYSFFLVSGLGVVFTKYFYQKTFIALEQGYKKQEMLNLRWTQYMLELSSLKTYGRVDQIARNQLGLFFPGHKKIHLVN